MISPLQELGEFEEMKSLLQKEKTSIGLTGCVDSQKLHMIHGLAEGFPYRIIVTFGDLRAQEIYEDYKLYDKNILRYPAKDLIFYQADIQGNQLMKERVRALKRIMEGSPLTIVTTFSALMTPQVPLEILKQYVLSIDYDNPVDEGWLASRLVEMGYEKTFQVETPGQFSIRGGIVDIFDLTEENPYRIELWGDTVDSLRSFDVSSQRSIEDLTSLQIYPATEMVLSREELHRGLERIKEESAVCVQKLREEFRTEEAHRLGLQVRDLEEQILELGISINMESYIRYFYDTTTSLLELFDREKTCIFMEEPARIGEHAEAVETEFRESMIHRLEKGYALPGQADLLLGREEVAARLSDWRLVSIASIDMKNRLFSPEKKFDISARSIAPYHNSFEALVKDLHQYKKTGSRVLLMSGSRTRAKRLAEDLRDHGLTAFYSEDSGHQLQPGEVMTYYGHVRRGFEYPLLRFVVISESDIFGQEKKKKRKRRYQEGEKIRNFAELKVGDYVVHESHGFGIYRGIEKIETNKVVKDYMKIEYKGGANLYVLATGLDVIQKYSSGEGAKPKLNKLGTQEWNKTKSKVRGAVQEVARDLLTLYAARQQQKGYEYGPDTIWQKEFEEMFPYEETEDQLSAIDAAKADMESSRIMDRLVCGDVGYGKTEVAIRAAFKAVQESKQVVYLVPTTILAQQHYNTFVQRMKDFPVRIDLLSRFRSRAEQKKSIEDLKKGMVDILIGTHRVLSADVVFKDLGLLIVDEEQRFGVTHKEKIKKMKENVDVLTLTATPIPRTLHMSLIGIRDMSVLEEAPEDRLPIQTYVMEYNEELVREAIVREMARNGQVYYVYNRVHQIEEIAAAISALVPEANVVYAHGQMKEQELEKIMYAFIEGEIDVLVSTTIIETGLDISNANTMIIHDADQLGLSQLYQLRGRVGRSNRTAYAFLMYQRDKLLKEIAEKRLAAIREFTDLGSGFKIAMRDLEIRGAGSLLGARQHGHINAVGYDMYCKLLNEEIRRLNGISVKEEMTTTVDMDVDAFIPPSYIVNEEQKLDIYKRIAGIENREESEDMKEELLDRFGEVPRSVDNLLRIVLIRVQARQLEITELKGKNGEIRVQMQEAVQIREEHIEGIRKKHPRIIFQSKGISCFSHRYETCGVVEKDTETLLGLTEDILETMKLYL